MYIIFVRFVNLRLRYIHYTKIPTLGPYRYRNHQCYPEAVPEPVPGSVTGVSTGARACKMEVRVTTIIWHLSSRPGPNPHVPSLILLSLFIFMITCWCSLLHTSSSWWPLNRFRLINLFNALILILKFSVKKV